MHLYWYEVRGENMTRKADVRRRGCWSDEGERKERRRQGRQRKKKKNIKPRYSKHENAFQA